MHSRSLIVLSVLVGFAAGAATVHGLHAQSQPPAYAIIELDIQQPEAFANEFMPLAMKAVTDQGDTFLATPGLTSAFKRSPAPRLHSASLRMAQRNPSARRRR